MIKYPKIQSLWKREGVEYSKEELRNLTQEQKASRNRFIEGSYSCNEFSNIKRYVVTEKVDGTNLRVFYKKGYKVSFAGRTDAAQLPPKLLEYLHDNFTTELFATVFPDAEEVLLFGEGYGAKIQKGGGDYSKEQRFVLFDVFLNGMWWMEHDNVMKFAESLGVPCVPLLRNEEGSIDWGEKEIIDYVKSNPASTFAKTHREIEGVVARAYPMMLTRDMTPIKFKLKCKDFK